MGDRIDKFQTLDEEKETPMLDDSILYLSSNWSARMSIKTNHEQKNENILARIPDLNIQKALDLPESDDEVETEVVPEMNKT